MIIMNITNILLFIVQLTIIQILYDAFKLNIKGNFLWTHCYTADYKQYILHKQYILFIYTMHNNHNIILLTLCSLPFDDTGYNYSNKV